MTSCRLQVGCRLQFLRRKFSQNGENFQVKENKTKMRNIHPRFFHLLFWGLRLGFRLGFGLGFDLGIVLEKAFEFRLHLSQN